MPHTQTHDQNNATNDHTNNHPPWPIQDIVLFLGFCARISTIIDAPTLCLAPPLIPVIADTIAQYNEYVPHNIGNGNIVYKPTPPSIDGLRVNPRRRYRR